jgi:hypothetical protein
LTVGAIGNAGDCGRRSANNLLDPIDAIFCGASSGDDQRAGSQEIIAPRKRGHAMNRLESLLIVIELLNAAKEFGLSRHEQFSHPTALFQAAARC